MSRMLIWGSTIILGALWMAWLGQEFILQWADLPWKGEALGQLGDTFGALNALFSAFAFIAVLVTLKQQRDDVDRQLRQQRDDLARQQRQITTAERDQHIRHFEQTFYELLRLLREARNDVEFTYSEAYRVDSPSIRDGHGRVTGTEAFKRANFEMRHWIARTQPAEDNHSQQTVAAIYSKHVHSRYESSFSPYYRLLYTLLLRIRDDDILIAEQKQRYGNLLRSQLTSHEVALCCYNGLAAFSGSFKGLIVEFRLAKYLPDEFGRKILMLFYPASTFEGRD